MKNPTEKPEEPKQEMSPMVRFALRWAIWAGYIGMAALVVGYASVIGLSWCPAGETPVADTRKFCAFLIEANQVMENLGNHPWLLRGAIFAWMSPPVLLLYLAVYRTKRAEEDPDDLFRKSSEENS